MATKLPGHPTRVVKTDVDGPYISSGGRKFRPAHPGQNIPAGTTIWVRTRTSRPFGRMADILLDPGNASYDAHWPAER